MGSEYLDEKDFARRFKQAVQNVQEQALQAGGELSLNEIARTLETPSSTVRAWSYGKVLPTVRLLARFCVKYEVSLEWLVFGQGTMRGGVPYNSSQIPLIHSSKFSTVEEALPEARQILHSREWADSFGDRERLVEYEISDDSMEPLCKAHSTCFVERTEVIESRGHYLLGGHHLQVRQVEPFPGFYRLRSPNEDYSDLDVSIEDFQRDYSVEGRVVGLWRWL